MVIAAYNNINKTQKHNVEQTKLDSLRIYNEILLIWCERTGKKYKILIATLWGQFSDLILRKLLFYFLIRVLALKECSFRENSLHAYDPCVFEMYYLLE